MLDIVRSVGTRHPRVVLVLKIVLVAVIVTATVLAIAQDQETVELRSAISAEDPAAAEYLAALVAADLVDGNTYDVLVNGDQVFPAMLQAIEEARERISFETYVYDKGRVADQFTDALEKAARRGVMVNVILDALGAGSMDASHLERLRKAGCHIVNFNPTDWYTLEELNYRTHRKILVVDGSVGIHWRSRDRGSLAGQRAGPAALARHAGPHPGSDRADARSGVLREFRRRRVHGHACARPVQPARPMPTINRWSFAAHHRTVPAI